MACVCVRVCVCTRVRAQSFSHVRLFESPWTVARQAPLSLGFSRQEYWSRFPFPSPGDLPDPGIKPTSPVSLALAGKLFTTKPPGNISALLRSETRSPLSSPCEDPARRRMSASEEDSLQAAALDGSMNQALFGALTLPDPLFLSGSLSPLNLHCVGTHLQLPWKLSLAQV